MATGLTEVSACVEELQSPLQDEIRRLSDSIGILEGSVGRLYDCIGPILSDRIPTDDSCSLDDFPACEVGRQLHEQSDKINEVSGLIEDAIARCQV